VLGFFASTNFSREFARYQYNVPHEATDACDTPVAQAQAQSPAPAQANSSPCN
jgi:hypothetical protein